MCVCMYVIHVYMIHKIPNTINNLYRESTIYNLFT